MQREDTKPWYRQFWPWFIISIPAGTVIAAFITIYIASKDADSLVKSDYYKKGLAVNLDKSLQEKAAALKIAARLNLTDEGIELQFAPSEIAPEKLLLQLAHPTQANLDQNILLTRHVDGIFRGIYQPLSHAARWYLTLTPEDHSWSLQRRWTPAAKNHWVDLPP